VDPGRVAENLRVLRKRFLVEAEGDPMEKGVRLHLALADIAKEQRLDSLSVDCWTEILPEFGVSPCLGFAFESCRIACEGDLLLALALLAGEALGGSPGYAGDLYAIDEQRGWATSVHCGACAELQGTRDPIAIVSCAPPRTVTGHGAVLSVRPVLPAGGATVAMFHGANANQLHVRAAKIIDTSFAADMRVRFSIEGDAGAFRREAAGNHYAIFPGDASPAWRLLATWLGITAH
jgi:L-fucose isomerase-like protein